MTGQQDGTQEVPVKERAAPLRIAALATHGYLGEEGGVLDGKIEDVIYNQVIKAEVSKTADRSTTAITRTALTRAVVPNMPGPGDFAETDDPEAAEEAWTQIHELVWRKCDTNAKKGPIQARLNGEHSVILCRTNSTSEGVWGVYVTRDWRCILEDFVKPDQKRVALAIARQAANSEMGSERLPEFGKKFKEELSVKTKRQLETGLTLIQDKIDASTNGND